MHIDLSCLVLPGNCLLCRQPSHRTLDLCVACEKDLPLLGHACTRCALPLPGLSRHNEKCGACLQQPPPQQVARAAFRYTYPLDHLVQGFKFNADHAAGNLLGQLFATHVAANPATPIVLLPVPLHKKRLRERGYNQAALLAEAICERHDCGLDDKLLARTRETAVQSNMNAAARRRNVHNAFSLRTGNLPQHVAIVDDVVTTGSTTREIARLLRRHGVPHIEVWALARTAGAR